MDRGGTQDPLPTEISILEAKELLLDKFDEETISKIFKVFDDKYSKILSLEEFVEKVYGSEIVINFDEETPKFSEEKWKKIMNEIDEIVLNNSSIDEQNRLLQLSWETWDDEEKQIYITFYQQVYLPWIYGNIKKKFETFSNHIDSMKVITNETLPKYENDVKELKEYSTHIRKDLEDKGIVLPKPVLSKPVRKIKKVKKIKRRTRVE